MRLRKLLIATAAIATVGTMVLAPTTQANTPTGTSINRVAVGGSTTNGTHAIALTMKSASLSTTVFGIPVTVNCSAATGAGVVRSGTLGVPIYEMTVSSMTMACPSIFPGTTMNMNAVCPININYLDLNVHVGLSDTGTGTKFSRVAGTMHFTDTVPDPDVNCLLVEFNNGCTFRIGATSTVAFDEAVKANGSQDLILSNNTLRIRNVNNNCQSAVANEQGLTINAVFNVASPNGPIDFQ